MRRATYTLMITTHARLWFDLFVGACSLTIYDEGKRVMLLVWREQFGLARLSQATTCEYTGRGYASGHWMSLKTSRVFPNSSTVSRERESIGHIVVVGTGFQGPVCRSKQTSSRRSPQRYAILSHSLATLAIRSATIIPVTKLRPCS